MFNNKYSKLLTIILIVVIALVAILLTIFGIDVYRKYYTQKESQEAVSRYEEYLNGIEQDEEDVENNDVINELQNDVDPIIDLNTIPNNTTGNTGTTTSGSKVQYKGYDVIGTIEIPKTNIKYPII